MEDRHHWNYTKAVLIPHMKSPCMIMKVVYYTRVNTQKHSEGLTLYYILPNAVGALQCQFVKESWADTCAIPHVHLTVLHWCSLHWEQEPIPAQPSCIMQNTASQLSSITDESEWHAWLLRLDNQRKYDFTLLLPLSNRALGVLNQGGFKSAY